MLIDGRLVLRDDAFPGVSDVDGVIAEVAERGYAIAQSTGMGDTAAPRWVASLKERR